MPVLLVSEKTSPHRITSYNVCYTQLLRGTLPDADRPEAGEAGIGQVIQLFIRNLVEPMDMPAVFVRQLLQPDIGRFGQQHGPWHPVEIGGRITSYNVCYTKLLRGEEKKGATATHCKHRQHRRDHLARVGAGGRSIEPLRQVQQSLV